MARLINRHIPGFFYFEAKLESGEILVLPTLRSSSGNGTNALSVSGLAGTTVSYTTQHHEDMMDTHKGQKYFSSMAGDYPATSDVGSNARIWTTPVAIKVGEILEIDKHMTALKITAPADAAAFIIIYGDY